MEPQLTHHNCPCFACWVEKKRIQAKSDLDAFNQSDKKTPIHIYPYITNRRMPCDWDRVHDAHYPSVRALFQAAAMQKHRANRSLLHGIHPWDQRDLGISHLVDKNWGIGI